MLVSSQCSAMADTCFTEINIPCLTFTRSTCPLVVKWVNITLRYTCVLIGVVCDKIGFNYISEKWLCLNVNSYCHYMFVCCEYVHFRSVILPVHFHVPDIIISGYVLFIVYIFTKLVCIILVSLAV